MRVLIADQFSPAAIEQMLAQGMHVTYNDKLAGADFVKAMSDEQPNVLVVRSKKVTPEVIDASQKLQLIVRAGAGTDTIDVKHAARKGVYVANCPGKNAHAVAELAIGLLLSIDRRMAEGNQMLHEGKWNKGMFATCKGVKGRTLGLVGFGNIAQAVCKTALALEMKVLVHTRTQKKGLDEELGFTYCATLDELLQNSDVVSLHTPSTAETKGMVNKDFLAQMKPNGVLINTARGNLVVEDDLLAKLDSCPDFWVGTDVFNGEPSTKQEQWSSPLSLHPRVYGTHHCGASTQQAEAAIGQEALRVILKFAKAGEVDLANTVNRAQPDPLLHSISVRHYDKVGALLHILQVLQKHNLSVQEMENIPFAQREACVCNLRFSGQAWVGNEEAICAEIKQSELVIDVKY